MLIEDLMVILEVVGDLVGDMDLEEVPEVDLPMVLVDMEALVVDTVALVAVMGVLAEDMVGVEVEALDRMVGVIQDNGRDYILIHSFFIIFPILLKLLQKLPFVICRWIMILFQPTGTSNFVSW